MWSKMNLPKKLLACSGNHLSLLPQIAKIMTPMHPDVPPPKSKNPVPFIKKKGKFRQIDIFTIQKGLGEKMLLIFNSAVEYLN